MEIHFQQRRAFKFPSRKPHAFVFQSSFGAQARQECKNKELKCINQTTTPPLIWSSNAPRPDDIPGTGGGAGGPPIGGGGGAAGGGPGGGGGGGAAGLLKAGGGGGAAIGGAGGGTAGGVGTPPMPRDGGGGGGAPMPLGPREGGGGGGPPDLRTCKHISAVTQTLGSIEPVPVCWKCTFSTTFSFI